MNHLKKINLVKKQNEELTLKIKEIQNKYDIALQDIDAQKNQFNSLIADLEKIKNEWEIAINDLEQKRLEYERLIEALYEAKGIMKSMNFKIPWYKKILLKNKK